MAWNIPYENSPLNGDDPGEGALELRTLKGEISKRGSTEHFWGADEDDLTARLGAHKEGSARSLSIDEYTGVDTERTENVSSNIDNVGSIRVTYTDDPLDPQYDGEDALTVSTDDTKYAKIEVRCYVDAIGTLGWITIFDKVNFANLKFDQDIDGRKTFILNPVVPTNPAMDINGTPYGTDWFVSAMDNVGASGDVAPSVNNIRAQLISMLKDSPYDPALPFAQWIDTQDGTYIDVDGYVDRTIKVTSVVGKAGEFESLKGVVWV